ncbi:MAG: hypothetical protein ABIR29_08585, partial [Chthoniobacterales bacterium]
MSEKITIDPPEQETYLQKPGAGPDDLIGQRVAISGDAGRPAEVDREQASAAGSGTVYVFVRNQGVWSQQARLEVPNNEPGDIFGFSLAFSRNTLVFSTYGKADDALA